MNFPMDWAAIASILGERFERPLVLLDRHGRIRMFNRAMEQVLGWSRFEVEGQLWAQACTPPEYHDESRRWIQDALRGALWSFEARALSNKGTQVMFRFEFSLVGRGNSQGLLLTATQWQSADQKPTISEASDLEYDIATGSIVFGTLVRLSVDSEGVELSQETRCYTSIHGLERPCEHCPVTHGEEMPWPRVFVRHLVERGTYEIRTASQIDKGLVRIRRRTITERTLEAIHSAKIEQLSNRADLSSREREILTYLVLGRDVEEIATQVGIAVRTVKYHQANLLQKLGADSRADLMRLLF